MKSVRYRPPSAATLIGMLKPRRLIALESAGLEVLRCSARMAHRGRNAGSEIIGVNPARLWQHYPADDAHDSKRGLLYYYHCHASRPAGPDEHGHFHVFVGTTRARGPAHLVAISIDAQGQPKRAFTTNRWVTGESPLAAKTLAPLARALTIRNTAASSIVDRWLGAVVRLFSPQIEWLLQRRDQRIDQLQRAGRMRLLDDRRIQIWSQCRISIEQQIAGLEQHFPG